jgi:DNA-binding FadR family transcriptional regulator
MGNVDVQHDDESADHALASDDALVESMLRGRPGPLRSLVAACRQRQQLFKRLIDWRHVVTTQEAVAAAMQTSQSAVARLEKGGGDPKLSTLERYAAAIGAKVRWEVAADHEAVADSPHLDARKVRWASASMLAVPGLGDLERLRRARSSVDDLVSTRAQTEQRVARLAAERRTGDDLRRLQQALEALPEVPEEGFGSLEEVAEFRRADREFHLALAAASHDDRLREEVAEMLDRQATVLRGGMPCRRNTQRALHGEVLAAIEDGDPDRAAAAMAEHGDGVREVIDGILVAQLHQRPRIVEAVLQVRQTTECLAARLAAERRTDADCDRMHDALRRMPGVSGGSSDTADVMARFLEADRELHGAIAMAAHDPVVERLAIATQDEFSKLIHGIETYFTDLHTQWPLHRAVVDCICERRPDDAAQAMGEVITTTRQAVLPALDRWLWRTISSPGCSGDASAGAGTEGRSRPGADEERMAAGR